MSRSRVIYERVTYSERGSSIRSSDGGSRPVDRGHVVSNETGYLQYAFTTFTKPECLRGTPDQPSVMSRRLSPPTPKVFVY